MRIKESKELKFPKIMFHTIWANLLFVLILSFWFLNWVLYSVDYPYLSIVLLGLITFGIVAFYLLMLVGPGEAFAKKAPEINFQDFKRSVVYSLVSFLVLVILFQYNKVEPKQEILVKEKTIKITNLSIFDSHHQKIIYCIGFKDSDGILRWQSNFTDVNARDNYLTTLVEGNKFKVEINFKIDKHNKGSLEIIKQQIEG